MSFHRRHWVVAAAVVLLAIGGYWTYLSWGEWGVFVARSCVTLAAASAPMFLLLPRSWATVVLFVRLMIGALLLMLIGWGLVALLDPEHVIGWWLPDKYSNVDEITDESDALLAGWVWLGFGVFLSLVAFVGAISGYRKDSRAEQRPAPTPYNPRSRNPAVSDSGDKPAVVDRLRRGRDRNQDRQSKHR